MTINAINAMPVSYSYIYDHNISNLSGYLAIAVPMTPPPMTKKS